MKYSPYYKNVKTQNQFKNRQNNRNGIAFYSIQKGIALMHALMKTKNRVLYATKPRLVGIVNISCIVILDTTKINFLSKNKNIYIN